MKAPRWALVATMFKVVSVDPAVFYRSYNITLMTVGIFHLTLVRKRNGAEDG